MMKRRAAAEVHSLSCLLAYARLCMVKCGHGRLCSRVALVIVGFNSTQATQTHTENTFCSIKASAVEMSRVLMVGGPN